MAILIVTGPARARWARRSEEALDYLRGGRAERQVGAELDKLGPGEWQVLHNLRKDYGGNIDHLVWGARGAYAIETRTDRLSLLGPLYSVIRLSRALEG